jgi:hypothetical protein
MTDVENLLTVDNFMEWVNSKNPDDVVGVCHSPDKCPVATYLKTKGVIASVSFGAISIFDDMGMLPYTAIPTPEPFQNVIRVVDANHPTYHEITASELVDTLSKPTFIMRSV